MQNSFLDIINKHEAELERTDMIANCVGFIKLFLVLCVGILLYLIFSNGYILSTMALCGVVFILLVVFWIYHIRLSKEIDYCKGIISICNRQLSRANGEWTSFEDTGADFIDPDHPYSGDLDIIGAKSLFQFLNSTHTWHGRQVFANDLLQPAYSRHDIEERQKAVSELSRDIEFACELEYYCSKIVATSAAADLAKELRDKKPFVESVAVKALLAFAPILTFIFNAWVIAFGQTQLYLTVIIIAAIQAVVWVLGMPKTQKYLGAMARLPYRLSAYSALIGVIIDHDFTSQKLVAIKERLQVASQGIKELGRIADKISVRHNGVLYFLLNVFLLWDYECALLLEGWKSKYADLAEQWFITIGELESLLSFSHLPNACDNTALPTITENRGIIEAREMGHPLLRNENRVNNDLRFNNNIYIISGSNMSGKTTFLRTVGINLVLARAGSFVCAKEMTCSYFDIMTSMRIADDLNEGVSTFYAELKRIKGILDYSSGTRPVIFLIDEIFRGTNSVDRLTGAKAVIARLDLAGASGMISTHDLELCNLAAVHGRVENFSFSESYKENQIHFDYKIEHGMSKTTNAKYLMKMLGIT